MTIRRARESQAMVSGAVFAMGAGSAAASVISLSLLPFAPGETEIGKQRREHQERDHRHGDCGALAELTSGDAALKSQGCEGPDT